MRAKSIFLCLILLLLAFVHPALTADSQTGSPSSYDELISIGRALLKEGKLTEAYSSAMEAEKSDNTRYESYALAALVFEHQNKPEDALNVLKDAIARAPETKKAKLLELQQTLQRDEAIREGDEAGAEGLTAKAANAYRAAWEAGKTDASFGLKAASLFNDRLHQPVDAARILREIIATFPESPPAKTSATALEMLKPSLARAARDLMDQAMQRQGSERTDLLLKAREADPDAPQLYSALAESAASTGGLR
jgi:tetratricopeptide (TPR) repeat protein